MPSVSISDIPTLLDDFLATSFPSVNIAFQNIEFDPAGQASAWLRPVCKPGAVQGAEKGRAGLSRRTGNYIVDILAPGGATTLDAWSLAAQMEEAFKRQCISHIYIDEPYSENMDYDQSGNFQVRVTMPWWCWTK